MILITTSYTEVCALSVDEKKWKKDEGADGYDIVIPQITSINTADANKLNKTILNMVDTTIDTWKNCKIELKEVRDKYGIDPCYESIAYKIYEPASLNIVSIKFDTYHFQGGGHGLSGIKTFNIDKYSGRILTFDDIFIKGAKEHFETELYKKIKQEQYDSIYPDLNTVTFYFDDNNLIFVFPLYSIGPYAVGMPEFKFNKNDIMKYLRT